MFNYHKTNGRSLYLTQLLYAVCEMCFLANWHAITLGICGQSRKPSLSLSIVQSAQGSILVAMTLAFSSLNRLINPSLFLKWLLACLHRSLNLSAFKTVQKLISPTCAFSITSNCWWLCRCEGRVSHLPWPTMCLFIGRGVVGREGKD